MADKNTFRVGVSEGLRSASGEVMLTGANFDALTSDPKVELVPIPNGIALTPNHMRQLDACILALERVTAESFGAKNRMTLVARFGVGYDTIDVDACTRADVALSITPDGVRRPVAVGVIAMMLSLTTRLPEKDRLVRDGPAGWARRQTFPGYGLEGRTLGVVGVGNIGAEVVRLAQPFGLRFIGYDPHVSAGALHALGVTPVELDTLFADSDIVSINCMLNDETRGMIDAGLIGRMKPTAWFINTARGPIVDQAALTEALRERRIAGAGLDVFEHEPTDPNDPLLGFDNVLLAPHTICATDQCGAGISASNVAAVRAVIRGNAPQHVVNRIVLEQPGFAAKLAGYSGA